MALEEEVVETDRILAELAEEPAEHPIRKEYEPAITGALDAVRTSMKSAQDADTALVLARSRLERFKLKVDKARLETHGKLVVLLKDRKEADAFFRSTSSAPGSNEKEPTPGREATT